MLLSKVKEKPDKNLSEVLIIPLTVPSVSAVMLYVDDCDKRGSLIINIGYSICMVHTEYACTVLLNIL